VRAVDQAQDEEEPMPRDEQGTSETQTKGTTSRRDLLKRTLIVLGAAAIVQPSGGVSSVFAQQKTDRSLKEPKVVDKTAAKKKHGKKVKTGTIQPDTPKKDGGKIQPDTPKKDGGKLS
jgi:hypothetical protein